MIFFAFPPLHMRSTRAKYYKLVVRKLLFVDMLCTDFVSGFPSDPLLDYFSLNALVYSCWHI
jgi:hypothetical protein